MTDTAHPAVRIEKDSIGPLEVPMDAYYGVQTLRAMRNFPVSGQPMPGAFLKAHAMLKKAAAMVNHELGLLDATRATAIAQAADEIIAGKLADQLPVDIYQTGSGTSTNMNLNEVIASRANELLGGKRGDKSPVHPNDHVNMGQSSNDTIPTSLHVAALEEITRQLRPALNKLEASLREKSRQTWNVIKTGRTHLQDATPIRLGQEFLGHAGQVRRAGRRLDAAQKDLAEVALGGTAVGTGITAPPGFSVEIAERIAALTGKPFITAPNKFAAQGSLDAMTRTSAALRGLAVGLMKIANDMRWLASGPRCGLGELLLPDNEPGSSIMPGKVNPTQCEAVVMICIQVIGEDTAVAFAGSQGNFELNTMRPVIINNVLHSARILADGMEKFRLHSVEGTQLNKKRISQYVNESVMLVTALSPLIGYDKASDIAHAAMEHDLTLKQAALRSGSVTEADFDRLVDPRTLVGDGLAGS